MSTPADKNDTSPAGSPPFKAYRRYRDCRDIHWKVLGNAMMEFAERVADIAAASALIHEVIAWETSKDDMREDSDSPETEPDRVFGVNECWALARMSIASLYLLENEAERLISWAEKHHMPPVKEQS